MKHNMWTIKAAEEPAKPGDNKELSMGKEIEKEHLGTINWLIKELQSKSATPVDDLITQTVERIAQDHLKELPDYYTRLKKMESEAGS